MNLNFKHIKIKNFMSLGSVDLDLNNLGYVSITGMNNNASDNAKSNGSGKSSLLEALIWNLTGETLRGSKDVVNRFTTGGASVELTFDVDDNHYKITRYKDDEEYGSNLKIIINGNDKSGKGIRDSQKILEELLPDLDTNLLGSVIILGQGLPQKFTNNTPSGRKEILEKLSKSDFMIEDIKTKLSDRKTKLSQDLRKAEDLVLSLSSQKGVIENNIITTQKQLDEMPVRDYDNEIAEATIEYDYAAASVGEEVYIDIQNKLNDCRTQYKLFDAECKNELNETANEFTAELNTANNALLEIKLKIKSLNEEIIRLNNIKDVCPTCGQKLPDVHKVDTTDLVNELHDYEEKKKLAEDNVRKIENKKQEKLAETESKQKEKRTELEQHGKELKELFDKTEKEYTQAKATAEQKRKELEKLKSEKELSRYKFEELTKNLEDLTEQSKQLSEKILYNNIDKDNIKTHYDTVAKMLTVATRDFRGFLLSEIINFISRKTKEYSQEIFGHDKLEFCLNGNNIDISYCDKSYECLSGGERQRLDIIIQFAIRDMLVQYLDFTSNLLALDEVFDNLDSVGCQKIIDLISKKLNDIESIFVITHHSEDLTIPCDRELVIVKNNQGVSELQ